MSKVVPLPINEFPYQDIDPMAIDDLSTELWDGFIKLIPNASGIQKRTIKRPGLRKFSELSTNRRIDGEYWWDKKGWVISVSDGYMVKSINSSGGLSTITGDLLNGTASRATFADNGDYLAVANGGRIVYTDGTTATVVADADAPTNVTHIVFLDSWLLANNAGTGQVYFADFTSGAPSTWSALDVFTAESNPDNVIGLYTNQRFLCVVGRKSIEWFRNDGATPFVRQEGSIYARGGMSPYSVVFANETGYMFDDRRRMCRMDAYAPVILSTPFDKLIQSFSTVDDTTADYVTIDGNHFILFQFPSQGVSLLYDFKSDCWSRVSYWNEETGEREAFIGSSYCFASDWNMHIFGSRKDGKIYQMSSSLYDDDGSPIMHTKRLGNLNHGSVKYRKVVYELDLLLKSGVGFGTSNATAPIFKLRWRDNGVGEWGSWIQISLGAQGDVDFLYKLFQLGSYYSRQYEYMFTDAAPLVVSDAWEVLDINEH